MSALPKIPEFTIKNLEEVTVLVPGYPVAMNAFTVHFFVTSKRGHIVICHGAGWDVSQFSRLFSHEQSVIQVYDSDKVSAEVVNTFKLGRLLSVKILPPVDGEVFVRMKYSFHVPARQVTVS